MTSTNESESGIAGLSVVLRNPTEVKSTPLTNWLPEWEHTPVWIPRRQHEGVTRVMAVLSQPEHYPTLMKRLCKQISQNTTVEWQKKSYNLTGVEVDNHDLHVLQIPILAAQSLRANLGRAIHALCFRWLGLAQEGLAEQLHQQNNLPFCVAIQSVLRQKAYLRIGLLQKELLSPILWGISQDLGSEITLTDIPCRLGKWVEFLHTSSFETLTQVSPQKIIELQFLSPTSFKQGQRIQPFPLPELVFGSLLRRWNAFAPAALQFPALEWQGLTCAYELKTQALHLKGGAEIGTTGWVRYEFPDGEQAAIATTLAHFACFAGVGRKTGMGMGQVLLR
jgi:CRISPR-associated endoribonuclease Cas6